MNLDFLHHRNDLDEGSLHEIERQVVGSDDLAARFAARLLIEVWRLKHELDDPQFQYSGRIHRHAIISRNAEIDRLREEIRELKQAVT